VKLFMLTWWILVSLVLDPVFQVVMPLDLDVDLQLDLCLEPGLTVLDLDLSLLFQVVFFKLYCLLLVIC